MTPRDLPGPPVSQQQGSQQPGEPPAAAARPGAGPGGPEAPQAPRGPGGPEDAGAGNGGADSAFWAGSDGNGPLRRKRRWPRVLIAVGVFVALVVAGLGGLAWQRQSSYNGNIDRIEGVMPDDGSNRPGPNVKGTENWLLVGSDSRAQNGTTGQGNQVWKPGQQRTDTIMLLHLPADRKKAYIVSFPRDSWVEVPGHGNQKINAAFSYGGPKLLIETVESLTGIRVDHYGAIDFEGFKSMTDALGGVTVDIKETVYDPARKKNWTAGKQKLDGEEALLFVRQRYNLPNGDFDRIKRQQAFLGALAKQAADRGTLTNPLKLDRFLSALTNSISVDEGVSAGDLRSLALSMRSVRASDVMFMTAPHKGTGMRGRQSVVFLDAAKANALFEAVKTARMAEWAERHGAGNSLGTVS
ncbi:LytR family transcriptional regulator [Actinomadura sp. KC345]|uniref:LCP family protein n=1 Tax=Actinomadura sp. KC345 TaxID=2530371 RepID=UPI0010432DA4|nr:LCP family protein [Actinomadura sp. KC345]TDC55549.1 LytR family transcriptional regulator [Actinomadura sp. KC345]